MSVRAALMHERWEAAGHLPGIFINSMKNYYWWPFMKDHVLSFVDARVTQSRLDYAVGNSVRSDVHLLRECILCS